MNDLVAFIVGIERYDQPGWNVPGPCANAIAVARWLLDIKVSAGNIHLFLDPYQDLDAAISGLKARGVQVTCNAKCETIDDFVRGALAQGRAADSRLLVYWSGHGFSANDGTRVFICSDYTVQQFDNRVYDGSGLCHTLCQSTDYHHFREQLFLVDVCAVYSNLKFDVQKVAPRATVTDARQVAFFATPVGKYAHGDNDLGVFTKIVLDVLGEFDAWPDLDGFRNRMEEAFSGVGQSPFLCERFRDGAKCSNRLVGTIPADPGSEWFRSVWTLLSAHPVDESVYWRHYRRTVHWLGNPGLHEAQGLSGMIRELSLCTPPEPGQVPEALVDFLVRLRANRTLAKPIAVWLKARPEALEYHQANARKRVVDERRKRILVVQLQNDAQGDINYCDLFLRNGHWEAMHEVPDGLPLCGQPVAGWGDFVQRFPTVVAVLHAAHPISEIHFAVQSALFDRPFHRIAIGEGRLLGEKFVVLVRYLDRLRDKSRTRHCWCAHAVALRGAEPNTIEVLPIPGPGSAPAEAQGFCYTRFTVPSAPGSAQKSTLERWLLAGFPYLAWSHEPPHGDDWDALGQCYADWFQRIKKKARCVSGGIHRPPAP